MNFDLQCDEDAAAAAAAAAATTVREWGQLGKTGAQDLVCLLVADELDLRVNTKNHPALVMGLQNSARGS
jgi:hypothetical protein